MFKLLRELNTFVQSTITFASSTSSAFMALQSAQKKLHEETQSLNTRVELLEKVLVGREMSDYHIETH